MPLICTSVGVWREQRCVYAYERVSLWVKEYAYGCVCVRVQVCDCYLEYSKPIKVVLAGARCYRAEHVAFMASSAPPRRKHGRQSMEFDDRCVAEGSAWSTRAKEIVPGKKKRRCFLQLA